MHLINKIFILYALIHILYCSEKFSNKIINETELIDLNGVYIINPLINDFYFSAENNTLILSNIKREMQIIKKDENKYIIISKRFNKIIGINESEVIILYDNNEENKNLTKIYWNLIKININQYIIQNNFNQKFLMVNNRFIQFYNKNSFFWTKKYDNIDKNFIFNFIKLYEVGESNLEHLEIIDKEPIDVLIKYIDLSDKTLNRKGIKQIYKDQDNEELRFCIRSILENIPWIRKIYILMPNRKVKYFKEIEEIKEKIIYINDKEFLGYDSANIFAFTFNLYKMEKFGISKNFIYMEDDFFIGKSLKKSDFFYFDKNTQKILPYLLTKEFNIMNKTEVLNDYYKMLQDKDLFHPHSGEGWLFSILSTDKYFIEKYNMTIINTLFTHNAIAENIDDLKEIYKEILNYEYINETLYSKERHILTLNQPHFVNLYQLNIKHKKVHSIPYKYIAVESIAKENLDIELFVLNTGGNHIPTNRQFKIQKKIMKKRFPYPTKYEIEVIDNKIIIFNNFFLFLFFILFLIGKFIYKFYLN